jgi:hypothetical protein
MRRLLLFVLAGGVVGALLAGPAATQTPPSLFFELSSGSSYVKCAATAPATVTKSGQSCTITQPSGGTAWCIEYKSSQSPIVQTCTIKQTSTTRANFAYVVQIAEQRGGSSPQSATQSATVEQGNTVRTNNSSVKQLVRQALGRLLDDDGDHWGSWSFTANANQVQDATQIADICQGSFAGTVVNCVDGTTMLSHNNSSVGQKQWQSEQAAARDTINQEQNSAVAPNCSSTGQPANMCADVDQATKLVGPGRNEESLEQLYVQLQNARGDGDTVTNQRQGGADVFTGGLEHQIVQAGGGVASITTGQNSFQFQKASNVGTLTQKQDPRISKDPLSTQAGAAGTSWTGKQRAFQFQFEDGALVPGVGGQRARLEYFGTTTGTIEASQFVRQNERTDSNSCGPGTTCAIVLDCSTVEPDPGPDLTLAQVVILQTPPPCVKTPAPGPD